MTSWVYPGSWPSARIHVVGVGFVDGARETNKAHEVVEIYLETGAMPTRLTPFCSIKTKIENPLSRLKD